MHLIDLWSCSNKLEYMLKPDFSNRLDGTFNPHFSNTYALSILFIHVSKKHFFPQPVSIKKIAKLQKYNLNKENKNLKLFNENWPPSEVLNDYPLLIYDPPERLPIWTLTLLNIDPAPCFDINQDDNGVEINTWLFLLIMS